MDIQEIKKIIALFEKSEISELELETDGHRIRLKKEWTAPQVISSPVLANPAMVTPVVEPVIAKKDENAFVKAPLVGTFYLSANPQAKPYVTLGQTIKAGDVVCLIEAMKVMNEIKAHKDGVVLDILAENGKMVEFSQKLLEIGDPQ